MNKVRKTFCRTFQGGFRAALPVLPYTNPYVLLGISKLPVLIHSEGMAPVLIVTDPFLRSSGLTRNLEDTLRDNDVEFVVYDKTKSNPTVTNVEEALVMYHENNCKSLIAFGGGSAMDCAKGVGARVAYPNKTLNQMKGVLRVLRPIPPLVAIPTTAGTGSETTLAAVITDDVKKHKYALEDFSLIPKYAVLDATLTHTLPPHITATTGMDAMTHAVEAYIGRSTTKETRKLAMDAVRLIFANIEKAYKNGEDRSARRKMLIAAHKAGIAFSKSYVGYVHAVAHSLGGQYGIAHGLANSVLLPILLEDYGSCIHKKLKALAVNAGVADKNDSAEVAANKFIDAIKQLNRNMNIPTTLEGIHESDIDVMAGHADKEANPLYPVPKLMNKEELKKFYYIVAGDKLIRD